MMRTLAALVLLGSRSRRRPASARQAGQRAGGVHRHAGLRAGRHAVAGAAQRSTASSCCSSTDLGKTFAAPVAVTPEPMNLDWGPDARARIVVDPKGGLVVTFGIFQDKNFNGRAYFARSSDGGASFTRPRPITADTTSQRFEIAGVDPAGRVFAAWLDKRNVAKARAAGRAYPGAALAYAWEDGDADFGNTRIALDNTCECCRLGLAFAGAGRPAVVVPQHLPGLGARSWRRSPSAMPRRRDRCAASASTTGRSRPARITAPAWRSRPTARITSPGSPTAPRARACSMPAPIRPTLPYSQPRPCRRPRTASRRGPICSPTARRCISCGRSSTAPRWRCAGR